MIKFIPLNHNILQTAIAEIRGENNLLLFPTHQCKKEALKLYQQYWDFSSHQFLTMDEWKESLFVPEYPILKEEKRTLALYLSLQPEQKDFFKIKSYHQFIDLAQNFFSFWEEIIEEQVDPAEITEILDRKQTAGNWQTRTIELLMEMKQNYSVFLEESGFSDRLFVRENNDIAHQEHERIIIVNQFYFTHFEKHLIKTLESKVTILSQIPRDCFDEEQLRVKPDFGAEHIKPFITKKMQLFVSKNETNMVADLASELGKVEKAEIIDFQFNRRPYAHLLSSEYFSKTLSIEFSRTRFYRFWQHILELNNSRIKEGSSFLLSMQAVLNLVTDDDIFSFFLPGERKREKIRTWIFQLIDNDFKFIDLDLVQQKKPDYLPSISAVFVLLQEVNKLGSINDLVGFIVDKLKAEFLLADLYTRSDLADVLFSSLADFQSIEAVGLVQNWKDVFSSNVASNLIKLMLDYLKPKKIKLNRHKEQTSFNLNTLQNTRNLRFDALFILNVVEGVLPDRKHTQFLLNENQRKELGLKTYEDITLRDKYYFFRLLCNCRNACVFSRYNLEENVEISSFLEELKLCDLIQENPVKQRSNLHRNLFANLLKPAEFKLPDSSELKDDFFCFSYDEAEFPDNKLSLSFYKWEKLKNNPFEFYLEFISELKDRDAEVAYDFSSKLIGSIAHNIIDLVFKRLVDVYHSNRFKHNFVHNTRLYVQQAIEHYLEYDRFFKYISPHNFSDRYFQNIFLPILADGIENFFYRLHNDLELSDEMLTVITETNKSLERDFIRFNNIDVTLKGRPDLRLHTSDQKFIFDFKTGNSDYSKVNRYSRQLHFYKEICYLIDQPDLANKINSYLFFVEQKDMQKNTAKIDLKEEIASSLQTILKNGFMISEKPDKYENVEITRRDLINRTGIRL